MGTDIHGVWQARKNGRWEDIPSQYSQDRHYLLFAWLGNIRNGYGSAGVPTHSAVVPLTNCRGFPDDFVVVDGDSHPISDRSVIDPRRAEWHDDLRLWMGDHSYSWASAEEILSAEMPKILRTGIVPVDWFREWDCKTSPQEWCGGISGPKIVVSHPSEVSEKTTHVQIEWFEDTSKTLGYFLDEVRRLQAEHGEVRFVFGFDS